MKSGYRVLWTDHALTELEETITYLQLSFTDAEIARLAKAIELTIGNIARNPTMYPESVEANGIRRAVVLRFNTLYYRLKESDKPIEILSFFSNRRNPESTEF